MYPYSILPLKCNNLPIELQTAKRYLKIDHDYDDELLKMFISAVGCKCETYTGLSLLSRKWHAQYNEAYNEQLSIPVRPIQHIDKIEAYAAGTSKEISPKFFSLNGNVVKFIVAPPLGNIHIYFTAGFGESSQDIPADLSLIMLEHLAELYENRNLKSNFNMERYNDFRIFKI